MAYNAEWYKIGKHLEDWGRMKLYWMVQSMFNEEEMENQEGCPVLTIMNDGSREELLDEDSQRE